MRSQQELESYRHKEVIYALQSPWVSNLQKPEMHPILKDQGRHGDT